MSTSLTIALLIGWVILLCEKQSEGRDDDCSDKSQMCMPSAPPGSMDLKNFDNLSDSQADAVHTAFTNQDSNRTVLSRFRLRYAETEKRRHCADHKQVSALTFRGFKTDAVGC